MGLMNLLSKAISLIISIIISSGSQYLSLLQLIAKTRFLWTRPNLLEALPSASIPIIDLNDHDTDDGQGPSPLV
ncbi:hypothetical protein CFP56_041077 [Quercus suber]|uniref:Uncharacterized protein n=1 Tax=Quercus suber TaxID=58331 RepID=A0AAW0LLQ5_QUESU